MRVLSERIPHLFYVIVLQNAARDKPRARERFSCNVELIVASLGKRVRIRRVERALYRSRLEIYRAASARPSGLPIS